MGGEFTEKYKRRSLLAFLLLLFKGRAKYVTIALLVIVTSLPFLASTETIARMLELPPVASFLKSVGLGGVISAINPGYSAAGFKAALDKAAADSSRDSFWNKFLSGINSTLPPADGPSSMAMIRGGDGPFGPPEMKDEKSVGPVKGVVNAEERAGGSGGGAVNLESMLSNVAGGGGVYGDLMGKNLGDSSYGAPFVNRTLVSKGGALSQSDGMYSHALSQAGSKIPVPGSPQKVNAKRMGKVSGFSWKNVGYKTKNVKVTGQMNTKKPLFQLAETFSMTGSAFKSENSAPEYQAAYTGATYDGNNVNADVITDAAPPAVPETGFTGDTGQVSQIAEDCAKAQANEGKKASDDAAELDRMGNSMPSPPKCYKHGAVNAWNSRVGRMKDLCQDFNANNGALAAKCQTDINPMGCGVYSKYTNNGGLLIKKCKKPNKWIKWLIALLCLFILIAIAVLFGPWVALLAALLMYAAYSMFGGAAFIKSLSDEASKPGFDSKK